MTAARPAKAITLDGKVGEWTWNDVKRTMVLQQTVEGGISPGPKSLAQVACDSQYLYLGVRVVTPKGYQLTEGNSAYGGDGQELALQSAEPRSPTPIFVLWGSAGGSFEAVRAGGASPAQLEALGKQVKYAAVAAPDGWTAEWRLPRSLLGPKPNLVRKLRFNLSVHHVTGDMWVTWVGTNSELFRVDRAGQVVLAR